MDRQRILELLDAAEMLHQYTTRRLNLAERDVDRMAFDIELATPDRPSVVRSFADLPSCKKRAFRSEDAAINAYTGSHSVRAYKCPRCSNYHLTKTHYA